MSAKIQINVYDFDKTIYGGDVSLDFYKFCLVKNPALLKYLPSQLYALILYIFEQHTKTETKQALFSFLQSVPNVEDLIHEFWKTHKKKIYTTLIEKSSKPNVIITASPVFLVKPITKFLGDVTVIGTDMSPSTGHIRGENCYGREKVKRLNTIYGDAGYTINLCYSDSLSDRPILNIAKRPYLVQKGVSSPYDHNLKPAFYNIFISTEFIRFIFVGSINVLIGVLASYIIFLLLHAAVISFIMGYVISLSISYILNTYITFKDKHFSLTKYLRFCLSYVPNFITQLLSVTLFAHALHMPVLIAYFFAAIVGVFVTFTLLKQYTFNSRRDYKK